MKKEVKDLNDNKRRLTIICFFLFYIILFSFILNKYPSITNAIILVLIVIVFYFIISSLLPRKCSICGEKMKFIKKVREPLHGLPRSRYLSILYYTYRCKNGHLYKWEPPMGG